jgi:hypothetical protein
VQWFLSILETNEQDVLGQFEDRDELETRLKSRKPAERAKNRRCAPGVQRNDRSPASPDSATRRSPFATNDFASRRGGAGCAVPVWPLHQGLSFRLSRLCHDPRTNKGERVCK